MGGSTSIIGVWKIDHYIAEDGNISQSDIGESFGENYQTANSAFAIVFERNGKATLYLPTYEGIETVTRECDYEIIGNAIHLSANGDTIKEFEMNMGLKTSNIIILAADKRGCGANGTIITEELTKIYIVNNHVAFAV